MILKSSLFCFVNHPTQSDNLHAGEGVGTVWRAGMSVLIDEEIDKLLETTSRSFYPTLKYLPKKIRGQIGLLYLLARVADTIADSKA